MLNRPNLVTGGVSALLVTPLLVLCVYYLDVPLAYFVRDHLNANLQWSRMTSNLPDLLLQVVLVTTCVALSLYLTRIRRGLYDATTQWARLVVWAAPSSYLVKSVLKLGFGRVNTRRWLQEPDLYGFHWFQRREGCDGFPSGHMVVIVTLLASLWHFYPRSRPFCLCLGLCLGVALIATDYHFLSDVIAGAYVGVLLEAVIFWLLLREPQHRGISAL